MFDQIFGFVIAYKHPSRFSSREKPNNCKVLVLILKPIFRTHGYDIAHTIAQERESVFDGWCLSKDGIKALASLLEYLFDLLTYTVAVR